MSSGQLVTSKRVRLEYYIAPGVSVANPGGGYEIDPDISLELLGKRFLKDVKEPGSEKSAVDELHVQWAVVRGDDAPQTFGYASMPISDTGLFKAIEPGDQLVLVPAGNSTAMIGFQEVACPANLDNPDCCVIS